MTVDIATLAIRIDSTSVAPATANLDRMRDAGGRAEQQTTALESATRKLQSALALLGIGAGVGAIIRMADEYTKFTAQLRLATQSQREYAAAVDDVRRIANTAQQDLAATGVLYARIANGARELGTSQKQVAAITETVNLALKVSGATASESASAMLQLSQSFASGTLRGEEFNAVNEAAPRLMKALADGIGVPVGALKKMAEEGAITSKIMADVLPQALQQLQEEAKQVQTISGAFTVLKNKVMEYTAVQAQSSGGVALLTSGIEMLANNLGILMGVASTIAAAKMATSFVTWAEASYGAAAASRALALSRVGEAESAAAATAAASLLANARLAELRATAAAAGGEVALGIALNGIIPAQARATVAAQAHEVSMLALSAAQTTAAATTTVLGRAMSLLAANPIGAAITAIGIAATAWSWYSSKADEANRIAAGSTEASTAEIIDNLEKQNAKLRERLVLSKQLGQGGVAKDGGPEAERAASLLKQINDLKAKGNALSSVDQIQLISIQGIYNDLMKQISEKSGLSAELAATGSAAQALVAVRERLTGVNKQYFTDLKALQTAREANAIGEKEYIDLVSKLASETWKASDSGKDFAATSQASVEARVEGIKSAIEREKNLRAEGVATITELNRQGLASDTALYQAKYNATIKAGQDAAKILDAEIVALASYAGKDAAERIASAAKIKKLSDEKNEVLRSSLAAAKQMQVAYEYDHDKPARDAQEAANKELIAVNNQVDAIERQIAAYNKLPSAVSAGTIAELEAQRATVGLIEGSGKAVAIIDEKIAAYKRLAVSQKGLEALDTGSDVAKAKELLDILVAVDNAAKQAADGMAASFGRVGSAIGGLTTALSGYAVQQQAIAAQLAAVKADPKNSAEKVAQAEIAASKASAQAQIKSYGDMAGAAKGFFKENTAGYKVLETTEKAFRAYEMAMALESMVKKIFFKEGEVAANIALNATKITGEAATTAASTGLAATEASAWGITAVVKAMASLPFPLNLAAGAATLAAVIAVGAKVLGSFGSGGGGGQSAAEVQKAQGTGSVFGDSSAKSDSIRRSIEQLQANSDLLIPINQGMLTSLQAIEASMVGLTNLVVRTPGLTDGTNMGVDTGTSGLGGIAGTIQGIAGSIPLIGGILGKVASLWGKTSTSIVDSGLQYGGGVRGLQQGQGFNQYASVDTTTSSWFGLSKSTSNSVQTQGLNDELSKQFGLIFTNLDKSLQAAAVAMGGSAADVAKVLDSLTLESTKISLKGLTGTALTDALNSVISKSMDEIASAAFPQFEAFRKVGEGYSETVMRLAGDYAKLDSILAASSSTFGATGIASIAAREHLIELAGGIDKLASQSNSFNQNFLSKAEQLVPVQKYVTDQLAAMGLQSLTTRDQFKDYVLGLASSGKLATDAGAQQYTALMALAEAFAKTHAATVDLTKSEQEIADERADLQSKLDELTLTQEQLAAKARAAIAGHNLALYDQVQAAQSAKNAIEERNSLLSIQAQIYEITGDKAGAAAVLERQHAAALALLSPALQGATQELWAAQAAADAIAKAKASTQSFGNALAASMEAATNAAKAFRALNDSLLIGASSALSPELKYAEAKRQFETAGGDKLADAEKAFLDASKAWFGGSAGYAADFEAVLARNTKEAAAQEAYAASIPEFWKEWQRQTATIYGVNGSHANGLDFVPFDGYRAELHRGERVQTAAAVRDGDAAAQETNELLRELIDKVDASLGADKTQRGAVGTAVLEKLDMVADKLDANKRAVRAAK